jgi:uncharacterized protein YkwD
MPSTTPTPLPRQLIRRLLPWLAVLPFAAAWPAAGVPDSSEVVREIMQRVNDFRRSQGVAPLAFEPHLNAAAWDFAGVLARTDRFGHDADGRDPTQRASAAGYRWCMVAENIALESSSAGFGSTELAQSLFEGWIHSPGHRRNLLAADATQTGIALAYSPNSDRWYAVQMFGRPASDRIAFDIANRSATTVTWRVGDRSWSLPPGMRRTDETCGATEVEVVLPGQPPMRLQPRDGTHFRIESIEGQLQVSGG